MTTSRLPFHPRFSCCLAASAVLASFAATGHAQRPAADLVLGQVNFLGNSAATAADRLSGPQAVAVDPTSGKVFVADAQNHRVLRYASSASLLDGAVAEAVFGQPDFISNLPNRGLIDAAADRLALPGEVFVDPFGTLWVADTGNHRVLGFFNASSQPSTGGAAGLVLGQADFTGRGAGLSRSRMSLPRGICVDREQRLWVADSLNHRVLRFDSVYSIADGGDAAAVLGQSDFTSSDVDVPGDSGATATELESPRDVALDSSGSLYVAEEGNHRVLVFHSAATLADGAAADRVLGQPDLTTVGPLTNLGPEDLWYPFGLAIDAFDRLFVSQKFTNRVTWFNHASTKPDGAPADGVIGQDGFSQTTANTDAQSVNLPEGLGLSDGLVPWIGDAANHRVLRMNPADLDRVPPLVTVAGKKRVKTERRRLLMKGSASDNHGVSRVEFRTGAAWATVAGTEVWRQPVKLSKKRTIVSFQATDPAGNVSTIRQVTVLRKKR